jgi:hypothetical protein
MPNSFKHTSWGRTRGPKNLSGTQGDEVDVVLVGTLDSVHDGYATENQRYLHVMLIDKHNSTNLTVTMYGYNHAFKKWAPMNTLGVETGVDGTPLTIAVADSGTAEGSQTAADREMLTWEIAGVDRVAFVGVTADVRCFAACSTF